MRTVVNVATRNERYLVGQGRLRGVLDELAAHGDDVGNFLHWRGDLPPNTPAHRDVPYAFKAFAIEAAIGLGFDSVLWLDSSIIPIRSLIPLWDLIERRGYWFSKNLPYAKLGVAPWSCGQWCADSALGPLGIDLGDREELFGVPLVIGGAFGLCLRHQVAREFVARYFYLARNSRAFAGPWSNEQGRASADPRVLGHRHDQTVASVIAWRLGMELTTPPEWIVDGAPATEKTVLEIWR